MQIVIDIPLEWLFDMKNKKFCQTDSLYQKILNGVPLPKGHGILKDENEIKQMIEDAKVKNESSKNFAENIIRFAPTIIEADDAEREMESEDKEWLK